MTLTNRSKTFLFLLGVILLSLFLETWKIQDYKLHEFDEGRFAANAFEMMQNGDYINLYYMNEPDAWVARPPLKSWLIIAGYKILGYNIYGARLSSFASVLLFMLYSFLLCRLFFDNLRCVFICLILLACKGIIGFHVGRTADMDAELIFFLTAFAYHFVQHYFFGKRIHAFFWGSFLALAFFLKTTASLLFIPGILLFILSEKRLLIVLKDKYFWYGSSVYLFTLLGWFIAVNFWGTTYLNARYAGNNAWQTMIIYDTWMRFTSSYFDGHTVSKNYQFYIHVLDSVFNIWNYMAYAGILWWVYDIFKNRALPLLQNRFLKFCLCILIPPSLLFTFGMHKLDWYTAPTLFFLSVFASETEARITFGWPYFRYIFVFVLLFGLVRHFTFLTTQTKEKNIISFIESNKNVLDGRNIYCSVTTPSNIYTWLCWQGYRINIVRDVHNITATNGLIVGQGSVEDINKIGNSVLRYAVYEPYNAVIYIAEANR